MLQLLLLLLLLLLPFVHRSSENIHQRTPGVNSRRFKNETSKLNSTYM